MRIALCLVVLAATTPLSAQSTVDTAGVGRLLDEAMNRSEVMRNLEYLSDVIGPRLSGSPAMRRSNEWTASRFKAYGVPAKLEPFDFGVIWERGYASLRLVAPFHRAITAHSWGWTEGTGGKTLSGPVVLVDIPVPESLAVYRDKVKGAWVLPRPPFPVWNPDGPAKTLEDSLKFEEALQLRRSLTADTSPPAVLARRQFQIDLPYILKSAGALGTLLDGGKEHALMTMSGSPNRLSPLPSLVISHEDYLLLARLAERGNTRGVSDRLTAGPPVRPRVEGRVENRIGAKPVQQWNTVAEIRGSRWPGQSVILGAHLDSWDLGTGVTDNGTGSVVVLEAARIIAQSGLKPKRSIRFILFSGEEQGLIGSRAYAAAHEREADSIQAVLVLDNGTGAITGQALQGRTDLKQLWTDLLAPVAKLDADSVREATKSGTDHLSFLPYGVPGFNFDQLPRGYDHTHHSQSDTYDKAVEGDLKHASAVMAITAWELANLPELLPRGPKTPVPPIPNKPSPGIAVRR